MKNNITRLFSTLASFFLLTGFVPASQPKMAAKTFDGRYYDTKTQMDFTDSSSDEVASYYGDIGSLTGKDFREYLYGKIHINTADIKKYYPSYTTGVTKWYKITDRNWTLSRSIDSSTYLFDSDTGDNYYETMLYFADNSTKEKQINTDVNSFTESADVTAVNWTDKLAPKLADPSGNTNVVQVDKEHVWVKSHGFSPSGDPAQGAGTDLHHLIAADHNTNNIHNDKYYGNVADHNASTTKTVYCHYADGTFAVSGWVGKTDEGEEAFEPANAWKGDCARAIFYMATNYCMAKAQDGSANSEAEPYLEIRNGNDGEDDNDHYHGIFHNLEDLLKWNTLDPVDKYETHRNNLIYKNVQNNRNPFVDHPEWVKRAFDTTYVLGQDDATYTPTDGEASGTAGGPSYDNKDSGNSGNSGSKTSADDSSAVIDDEPVFDFSKMDMRIVLIIAGIALVIIIVIIILLATKALKPKQVKKAIKTIDKAVNGSSSSKKSSSSSKSRKKTSSKK